MRPSKELIEETKAMIRLSQFLRNEVGLKEDLTVKQLKELLKRIIG